MATVTAVLRTRSAEEITVLPSAQHKFGMVPSVHLAEASAFMCKMLANITAVQFHGYVDHWPRLRKRLP
jgi:hypothetical protein